MRVAIVACGSSASAHLPLHLSWIAHVYPGAVSTVVLTRSARRFVTEMSVAGILGCRVLEDDWDAFAEAGTDHIRFGEEHDVILVYPATVDYIGRLASLSFSTPSVAAIATGTGKVVVCPALPPGIAEHPLSLQQRQEVANLPRTRVVTAVPGTSMSSTRAAHVPPPIWEIWDEMVCGTGDGSAAPDDGAPHESPEKEVIR